MNYVITIARGYGSGGRRIGRKLADALDIDFVDRELLQLASMESGINEALFCEADERVKMPPFLFKNSRKSHIGHVLKPEQNGFISDQNLFNFQAQVLKQLITKESFVVMGRAADFVLKDSPNVLSVSIQAPHDSCVQSIMNLLGCPEKDAENMIEKTNRYRADFYKYYTGQDWKDQTNFDLCLNGKRLNDDIVIRLITEAASLKFGLDFLK